MPNGKDLKLIWESGPKTEKIIERLRPLRDLATEESVSFSFGGKVTDVLRVKHLEQQHSAISGAGKDFTRLCPINHS